MDGTACPHDRSKSKVFEYLNTVFRGALRPFYVRNLPYPVYVLVALRPRLHREHRQNFV